METDPSEELDKPMSTGTVKIEWNWDFDDLSHEMKSIKAGDRGYTLGEEGRFRLKGRCRRCWGGLIGKGAAEPALTAVRCRVCGILHEGDDPKEEYQRISEQSGSNTFKMAFGFAPKYRDNATFVQKVFPHIDRQSSDELRQRINAEASKGTKDGWLPPIEFPAGSAGFLFLQAQALMSGVERLRPCARMATSLRRNLIGSGSQKKQVLRRAGVSLCRVGRMSDDRYVSPELSRLITSWRFGDRWWSS